MLSVTYKPFALGVIMLKVTYAECRYAECHYAECHYAGCRYAECRYNECRGAIWPAQCLVNAVMTVILFSSQLVDKTLYVCRPNVCRPNNF
jgi:hypothetical protein